MTQLVTAKQPLPEDYVEGYKMWRDAFLKGTAGVFVMPVAEVVNLIEETMSGQSQRR